LQGAAHRLQEGVAVSGDDQNDGWGAIGLAKIGIKKEGTR